MMFLYCTLVVVVVVLVEVLVVDVEVEVLKVVVVESIPEEVIPDVEAPPRLEETVEIVSAPVDKEVKVLPLTIVEVSPPLLVLAVIASVVVELETSFLVEEITWTSSDDVVSTFDVEVTLAFPDELTVTKELRDFKLIGEVVI